MARKRLTVYRVRRIAATLAGLGLIGFSAWCAWTHFHDLTAPIAAAVRAMMLHLSEASWQERQRAKAPIFLMLATTAALISGHAVLARVATVGDAKVQERRSDNLPRTESRKALGKAETEAKAATQATEDAARALAKECSTGKGTECRRLTTEHYTAQSREETARKRVTEARADLVRHGAEITEDPAAKRLAAFLPGVSEEMVGLAVPLLPPLWIELSGPLLLTYGLSHRRQAATRKRRKWRLRLWPRKAKKKRTARAAKPKAAKPRLVVAN